MDSGSKSLVESSDSVGCQEQQTCVVFENPKKYCLFVSEYYLSSSFDH